MCVCVCVCVCVCLSADPPPPMVTFAWCCAKHQSFCSPLQVKYVLMINCGAMIDVVETFQPEDHVIFFVCDRYAFCDNFSTVRSVE